jgi:hypothetical protein
MQLEVHPWASAVDLAGVDNPFQRCGGLDLLATPPPSRATARVVAARETGF